MELGKANLYLRLVDFKNSIKKNGLALSIAPLQLLTLAAFPPWGSSEGAGRRRLTQRKSNIFYYFIKLNMS